MPSTDYQWLTNRERRFLDDPDQFDQQTQSEIRYRLRRKYAGTVEAMDRLEDDPDLWDKKVRTGDATVKCQDCEATRSAPLYEYEQTGEDTVRIDDWQTVTFLVETHGMRGNVTLYKGYCESYWPTDMTPTEPLRLAAWPVQSPAARPMTSIRDRSESVGMMGRWCSTTTNSPIS